LQPTPALVLAESGRYEEALAAEDEAVAGGPEMVDDHPDAYVRRVWLRLAERDRGDE
jgi:hypothetical protein